MKELQIFENYGVLSAENRSVYTFQNPNPTAVTWDLITIEFPDGWKSHENNSGETIITAPWGTPYTVMEILAGDKEPIFRAYDDTGKLHSVTLKIVKC